MSMKRGKRNRTFSLVSCLRIGFDALRIIALYAHKQKPPSEESGFPAKTVLAFNFRKETAVCHLPHIKRHGEVCHIAQLAHLFVYLGVDLVAMLF